MNLFDLKPHRYSQILPPMSGSAFSELVASIKKVGRIRNAIIVYQNQILDGNHRLKACKIAKVEPKWIEFKGTDLEALDLVWDLNVQRRHLNESQRAVAFAQYCNFADSGTPPKQGSHVTPLADAAEKAGVSEKTMQRAKSVVEHGTKKDIESIKRGETTVAKVASFIATSKSKNGAENVDALGNAIPTESLPFWSRRKESAEILAQLRYIKTKIMALDKNDAMWIEVHLNAAIGELESVISRFNKSVPSHVCPYCHGKHPGKCIPCHGRGVVSAFFYKTSVPEEIKKNASRSQ